MDYDKEVSDSETEYFDFVHWLEKTTTNALREAQGDEVAIKAAIQRYLDKGYSAHLSSGELVDFFCVSTPSILDEAGFTDEEIDTTVKLYDELNYVIFPRYYSDNN